MLYLAGCDQILDGSRGVLDRYIGVDAVLIVKVDDIGPQPLEGTFHSALDLFRRAICPLRTAAAVGIDIESELGGDHQLFAEGLKRLADKFFIGEGAVYLCCVEKSDAAFDGGVEESDHLMLFRERFVRKAQAHATEAECGYFKIALSQLAFLH
jgi:hypothetical protein